MLAGVEDPEDLTRSKKIDGTEGNLTRSKKNDESDWNLDLKQIISRKMPSKLYFNFS